MLTFLWPKFKNQLVRGFHRDKESYLSILGILEIGLILVVLCSEMRNLLLVLCVI